MTISLLLLSKIERFFNFMVFTLLYTVVSFDCSSSCTEIAFKNLDLVTGNVGQVCWRRNTWVLNSSANPHHFDLIRIRIRFHFFDADPVSSFHFDADRGPTFYFWWSDANIFHWLIDPAGSRASLRGSIIFKLPMLLNFDLIRIRFRIQLLLWCGSETFCLLWYRSEFGSSF